MDIEQNLIECIFEKSSRVKVIRKCTENTLLAFSEDFSILSIQLEDKIIKKTQGYLCPFCLKLFARSKTLLGMHLEAHKGPTLCSRCKVIEKSPTNIGLHPYFQTSLIDSVELSHHRLTCGYQCRSCHKLFKFMSHCLRHERSHKI